MITCYDSGGNLLKALYQWDVDRIISMVATDEDFSDVIELHLSNQVCGEAITVLPINDVTIRPSDNLLFQVPNSLLQVAQPLVVYIYRTTQSDENYTTNEIRIPVRPRARPSSYEDAEAGRVAAELERVAAEHERQENELERIRNERIRIANENQRESAESQRATAEAERSIEETARANGEALRRQAENRRIAGEQDRCTAEAERIDAEKDRATAETQREDNETARIANEHQRIQNEIQRVVAEAERSTNENARISAEMERQAALDQMQTAIMSAQESTDRANAAAERAEDVLENFDEIYITALLLNHGMPDAFRVYMNTIGGSAPLTELTERFFTIAAKNTSETYVSSFYRYSTSPSPVGSKKGENATLVCEPSTNAVAGRDDYADLPLFACFDCNYTIDADTKEPVIHAIKDIYGEFSSAPVDSFVGVLQMTGWVRRTQDDTTKTVEYAAYRKEAGFKPLPEAVRARDNSVRPFVIHAKYAAGWNSQGKLSSVSGVMPMTGRPASVGGGNTSPSGQQTQWRRWGNQYTGSGICDQAFLQTMLEIKYANLGSPGMMAGCCTSTSNKTAAVSETGVSRILLTPEQASEYVVGVSVSLGSSQDRASTACYDVCGITRVAAVTSVTVNGVEYGAVELDASSPFDTVADATYIIVHPWYTGATDEVKGNDGSPYDNLSGREPFKLQGIEVMNGTNEAAADTSAYLRNNNTTQIRARRLAEGSYTVIGTVPNGGAATGWQYISELNWAENDPETYLCYTSSGATETTGYCSKWYQVGRNSAGERLYGMYPARGYGAGSGLCTVKLVNEMTLSDYTYSCRACGTAGNRGKYTENTETLG